MYKNKSKKLLTCIFSAIISCIILISFLSEKTVIADQNSNSIYNYREISYVYGDKSQAHSYSFLYSDSLFLCDATEINGDIAKMSVALATAAYNTSHIDKILGPEENGGMGFEIINKTGKDNDLSYGNSNDYAFSGVTDEDGNGVFGRDDTYKYVDKDNMNLSMGIDALDRVAYTLSRKEINGYIVYCVPIKGTSSNAEWYSDFHLGYGEMHEGFKKSAEIVYRSLIEAINKDNFKPEKTIILTTGHSRGAAISNIVGGWLTEKTDIPDINIFSYNFACPAVSINADTSMKNVINFNNPGDLITLLPLECDGWNYKRYGQTINYFSSSTIRENVFFQYSETYNSSCLSELTPQRYLNIFETAYPTKESFLTADNQLLFRIICWVVAKRYETDIGDKEKSYLFSCDNYEGARAAGIAIGNELLSGDLFRDNILMFYDGYCVSVQNKYNKLISFVDNNYSNIFLMSDKEFDNFIEKNKNDIVEIQSTTGIEITCAEDLIICRDTLEYSINKYNSFKTAKQEVWSLFIDKNGAIDRRINDAHVGDFYILWMNSEYYGCKGWYNNDSIKVLDRGEVTSFGSIGTSCFEKCNSLSVVKLPNNLKFLGEKAFNGCSNIISLTIPCTVTDYGYSQSSSSYFVHRFEDCINIETINITGEGSLPNFHDLTKRIWFYKYTPWYISESSELSINIADTVTGIGHSTFMNCNNIIEMTIPHSVKIIGDFAFKDCSGLKNLTISDGVKTIGLGSFENCTSLESVTIPGSATIMGNLFQGAFKNCTNLSKVVLSEGIMSTGEGTFNGCTNLEYVIFPDTLSTIDNYAFQDCSKIKSLSFPDSLTNIGDFAFEGCSNLNNVYIPGKIVANDNEVYIEGVSSIGRYAFEDCINLTNISIPISINDIGYSVFRGCSKLSEIKYMGTERDWNCINIDTNIEIEDIDIQYHDSSNDFSGLCGNNIIWYVNDKNVLFITGSGKMYNYYNDNEIPWKNYRNKINKVYFNGNVSVIENYAFYNCTQLTDIVLPEDLTTIEKYAFYNCTSIEAIYIPNSVSEIGEYAFYNCFSLSSITLPDNLTSIEDGVFISCENLSSIDLPENITNIKQYAFQLCTSLESISLPDSLEMIGYHAFDGCSNLKEITIPDNVSTIRGGAFYECENLEHIVLSNNLSSIENSLFEECKSLKSISIPQNVTYIGSYAFYKCISLSNVFINEGVTSLGNYSFYGCSSLEEINIPESITSIGNGTFSGCSKLKEIDLSDNITTIGDSAFYGCTDLERIDVSNKVLYIGSSSFCGCSNLLNFDIPDGVTCIKNATFFGCSSLECITIPQSVTNIQEYAFIGCIGLKEINYGGSEYNWNKIKIGSNNTPLFNADIHFSEADTYLIITYDSINGAYSVSDNEATPGDNISVLFTPDEGYTLDTITVNGEIIEGTSFTMPAKDTTVTVTFKAIDYKVNVNVVTGGTVEVSKNIANIGEEITVTAIPEPGYELDSIKVNGTVIDGTTFIMPAKDVIISVIFKKIDTAKNGWILDNGNYYYYNNGVMLTGWKNDGGKWYYLDPETGIMAKGWLDDNGTWYYFNNSGAMVTGWQSEGGKWYYFESSGAMFTGWKSSGGSWYYLTSSGQMATGWQSVGGEWYYFESSGVMTNPGWKQIGSEWYYFKKSGAMAANEYCEGYWLNSSGTWTYKHKATWRGNSSSGWWYGDDTGWYAKNETLKIDGKEYNFNSAGYCTNP